VVSRGNQEKGLANLKRNIGGPVFVAILASVEHCDRPGKPPLAAHCHCFTVWRVVCLASCLHFLARESRKAWRSFLIASFAHFVVSGRVERGWDFCGVCFFELTLDVLRFHSKELILEAQHEHDL
jgi:hypothetical protein